MELWLFWGAAAALIAGIAATLWRAMARAQSENTTPTADAASKDAAMPTDVALYRDQLDEVERDVARGTLAADEATRLRLEISRRLLEADRHAQTSATLPKSKLKPKSRPLPAMVLIGASLAGAVGLYLHLGAPGYPDLPLQSRLAMSEELRANRPSQAEAEAQVPPAPPRADVEESFLQLMAQLRQAVEARPDDLRGQELLARNEAVLGNMPAARAAQEALIALKGEAVLAEDHAALAELMVMAAGGYVSPQAEQEMVRALSRDPGNGTARYYSGLMFAQIGRFDRAFVMWSALLADSPPDAPWIAPLRAELPAIAARAGVNYSLPPQRSTPAPVPGAPGPSAEDIAAADALSNADRAAMVEGMVAQLGTRLASQGGSAEEWARLISALGVLGRQDEARATYAEARQIFAGQSVDLQGLREAAVKAGAAEQGTGE